MEEFLQTVWLKVYLKAMEIKMDPTAAASRAVKEATFEFPEKDYMPRKDWEDKFIESFKEID